MYWPNLSLTLGVKTVCVQFFTVVNTTVDICCVYILLHRECVLRLISGKREQGKKYEHCTV